jgi:hypothetical protein
MYEMLGLRLGLNNNQLARKLSEFITSRLPEEYSDVSSSESVSYFSFIDETSFHFYLIIAKNASDELYLLY